MLRHCYSLVGTPRYARWCQAETGKVSVTTMSLLRGNDPGEIFGQSAEGSSVEQIIFPPRLCRGGHSKRGRAPPHRGSAPPDGHPKLNAGD